MTQNSTNLVDTARQLLAIESILGSDWLLPVSRNKNPLPPLQPAEHTSTATATAEAPSPTVGDTLSPEEKAAALAELNQSEVNNCKKCPLHQTRNHVVFGDGDPAAGLVFVGEGPGADEDATGKPFVGRAGELLTRMIHAMGLDRQQVFICNIVKCRPPGNRNPAPEEVQACWNYLIRQLEIIRPRVIVTLGNPATQNLLQTRVGITKLRGNWQRLPDIGNGLAGTPVMPTFHPSYILRRYTPEIRGKAWSDLQAVMQQLGLTMPKK
ncbi:MAG: uracil-DNA glycosylase [Phycisphaerae bacterium]|nr:uracil-DNA glycosylase [Phycisphaerae bacterium]